MRPSSSGDPRPRGAALASIAALATLVGAASFGAAAPACSPPCDSSDDGNPPDRYTAGIVACDAAGCAYETSPWHGELLHFPGGKRYDLVHGLGHEPLDVQVYLSFSPNGVASGEQADSVALSAGNSSVIQLVNDQVIRVKNDTCSEFWVRVTASGRAPDGDAGATPDAGASDAADAGDAASRD